MKLAEHHHRAMRLRSRRRHGVSGAMLLTMLVAICAMHSEIVGRALADEASSLSLAAREEAALRAAVEHVAESVVQIRTIGGVEAVGGLLLPDGPTTGLVVASDGYIVSSAFNFVHHPTSILVTFANGKQAPAELVATDHGRMLVLLKVSGVSDLAVPTMAPLNEVRSGQWAVAVGRTYRADRVNVSVGIVSAVGRMFGKAIQSDAAVSTANYGGPLVDLRGRVLGVIVPMAPQGASEVAGVEWYDSGIGFAVPLEPIAAPLEEMKKGIDQRPGILGIGLEPGNAHALPAELTAVRIDSPAGQAGLKRGDRIVEIDGREIRTQTDLRFALGPRYGGERVSIVVERGEQRLERELVLAGELPAFRHAFLGILPVRAPADLAAADQEDKPSRDKGVGVRMVFSGSPAAEAGLKPGDRITRVNDAEVASREDALEALNNAVPGAEATLQFMRDEQTHDVTVVLARHSTAIPSKLPAASAAAANAEGQRAGANGRAAGETNDLKLPEFPHACKVYVPAAQAEGTPHALLLWLHAAGDTDADEVIRAWQAICDRDGIVLAVPAAAENGRWERTELVYLRRLLERLVSQYQPDEQRVVVAGRESGGAVAWLLALSSRDIVSGIAVMEAPLPRQVRVPPNEPATRLAVLAAVPATANASAVPIAESLQKLADAGYPVSTIANSASGELSETQREEVARWIDTLDRL